MKTNKPKGKTPSLIGSTLGAPRPCVVARQCKCRRCGNLLEKGTACHEIPQLGGSFTNYKRYCDGCYNFILAKTKADLEALLRG